MREAAASIRRTVSAAALNALIAEVETTPKPGLVDRLTLTPERIQGIVEGIQQVIGLEDPIGEVLSMKKRPNGLLIGQKRVPLGVIGMIYTGGFFDGVGFIEAFSNSDASEGLAMGSFFGLLCTIIIYLARKILTFEECMACVPEGFKAMVPAILILTFAWTLKAMTDSLGAAVYVADLMESCAGSLMNLLPAFIFLVGCFLSFATGTSWGTFGILIPIVVSVFANSNHELMVISISACMAGAVCGDHCSPISDTTIMASAGAQCNHVNHVSTQLPYAATVAAVSFVTYLIAGFVQTPWISLPAGLALLCAVLFGIHFIGGYSARK